MPASAQQQPVRIRGAVESLHDSTLTVRTREGPSVAVRLAPDWAVSGLVRAEFDDIKAGTYVGTAAEPQPDGTLKNEKLFFDFTNTPGEDGLDGIKVDQKGNLYVSAPGGLWVLSPEGKHLGTIITPRHVHNMAWGDADGKTLYLCARSGLYRIRLNVAGVRPS